MNNVKSIISGLNNKEKSEALHILRNWDRENTHKAAANILLTKTEKELALNNKSIDAIRSVRNRNNCTLTLAKARIDIFLRDFNPTTGKSTNPKDIPNAPEEEKPKEEFSPLNKHETELLKNKGKLPAILALRNRINCTMLEAKTMVENSPKPQIQFNPTS